MNELQIFKNNEFVKVGNKKIPGGFRVIKGYDNLYCINQYGDIISPSYTDKSGALRITRVIIPTETNKGYLRVALNKNDKQKRVYVHRLVAETFIPNYRNKPQVNHMDGNKKNNHVSNLEWCTNQENIIHSYEIGLREGTNHVGERNTKAKLTEKEVVEIINSEEPVANLADKFRVSKSCVYKIRQRKRWSHV